VVFTPPQSKQKTRLVRVFCFLWFDQDFWLPPESTISEPE